MMSELSLISASATDFHPTTFTTGYRSPVRQRYRRMVIIPSDHQGSRGSAILEAPLQKAASSFPVVNLSPNTGRPLAAFDTHEASPEQSVPAAVFPPQTYGVPET